MMDENWVMINSIDAKKNEACLPALAQKLGIGIRFFAAHELNTRLLKRPSHYAMKAVGAYGVAEPSAILAVGRGKGELRVPKEKIDGITLALGEKVFALMDSRLVTDSPYSRP